MIRKSFAMNHRSPSARTGTTEAAEETTGALHLVMCSATSYLGQKQLMNLPDVHNLKSIRELPSAMLKIERMPVLASCYYFASKIGRKQILAGAM